MTIAVIWRKGRVAATEICRSGGHREAGFIVLDVVTGMVALMIPLILLFELEQEQEREHSCLPRRSATIPNPIRLIAPIRSRNYLAIFLVYAILFLRPGLRPPRRGANGSLTTRQNKPTAPRRRGAERSRRIIPAPSIALQNKAKLPPFLTVPAPFRDKSKATSPTLRRRCGVIPRAKTNPPHPRGIRTKQIHQPMTKD